MGAGICTETCFEVTQSNVGIGSDRVVTEPVGVVPWLPRGETPAVLHIAINENPNEQSR